MKKLVINKKKQACQLIMLQKPIYRDRRMYFQKESCKKEKINNCEELFEDGRQQDLLKEDPDAELATDHETRSDVHRNK